MKGMVAEVDVKREKRIIRIPQRYLPLSSTSASKSTSRSVPNKKQRLGARKEPAGQASGGSEEETAVVVERSNPAVKRWVRLKLQNNLHDYNKIVGLQCKIYWPLDGAWYSARLTEYNTDTHYHHVLYDDGDQEFVILNREKIQFFLSMEEILQLRLSRYSTINLDDFSEMMVQPSNSFVEPGPGDVTWAKLTGHAAWPALVLEEELVAGCKGLKKKEGQKSYPVQFFGTHDLARVKKTEITLFSAGFVSNLHLKCKKPAFVRGLKEAELYLREKKLPEEMLLMEHDSTEEDDEEHEEGGSVYSNDEGDEEDANDEE